MDNKYMPAFPVLEQSNVGGKLLLECTAAGVNKLEFIACHAPNEIPGWFVHVPPKMDIAKAPEIGDDFSQDDKDAIHYWHHAYESYDLPLRLKWYSDQYDRHSKEAAEYNRQDTAARYFQWRKFYAEQLLLTLEA